MKQQLLCIFMQLWYTQKSGLVKFYTVGVQTCANSARLCASSLILLCILARVRIEREEGLGGRVGGRVGWLNVRLLRLVFLLVGCRWCLERSVEVEE